MKLIRIAAFVLLGTLPAHAETPPSAPAADPNGATIRGDIKTGFLDSTETHVVAIDGRLLYGPIDSCKRVPLTPGPHSLVVSYDQRYLPLRLDARPGADYALLFRSGSPDVLIVENEKTRDVVAQIPKDGEQTQTPPYVEPPASADLAAFDLGPNGGDAEDIKLLAVDGTFVPPRADTVHVASGPRAITIYIDEFLGVGGNYSEMTAWTRFPLLLEALPGTTYRLRAERPKDAPILGPVMRTVWIEDLTHNTATGKITFQMNVNAGAQSVIAGVPRDVKVDFPDNHGQIKRTAPKLKPWCQHD